MDAFPTTNSRWTAVHEDEAPAIQGGVCSDINGKKSVHWIGRLSEMAAGNRKIKLPKGYKPVSYVVEAKPLVDPVGVYGTGVALATGTVVTITAATKKRTVDADSGAVTFVATGATGGVAVTGNAVQVKGPTAATDDKEAVEATYGIVKAADLTAGTLVEDHDEYVELTASASGGTLDRAANDAVVDFRIWLDQIDPHPEFNH